MCVLAKYPAVHDAETFSDWKSLLGEPITYSVNTSWLRIIQIELRHFSAHLRAQIAPLFCWTSVLYKKVGWCSDLQHSMRNILIGQRSRTSSIPWRKLRREPPLRPLKQEKVSLFQEGRGDQKENIIVISLPPSALLSSNFEPGGLLSALDEHKEGPFISPRTSFWTILTVICCFKTCFRINWTVCVDWSSCKNVKNVFYLPK